MPVNQRRFVEVFRETCAEVPERFPGYRHVLLEAVADVMTAEREHSIRHTQIQQKVSDVCDRLGDSLAADSGEEGGQRAKRKR
ncbi:MAG: hypothetical protein HYY01_09860 [Chloroflexi bacterium]|nr:hypothetical protein [Chloroflexota bacterium]